MSKKIKRFIKRSAPVALPLLLGALSKKDVKLPPNPKMDAAVKGAQDALAENQRQIDMFNTPEAVREIARDPRMINTNMRRIAELRRRGPIMRTVPMETMQEGGMVEAAQDIADKGRNGDSMLVHMAPEEVQGIAALGGVSINPETGLPEMFKFKDFMKVAIPIAITAMAGPAGAAAKTAAGTKAGFLASTGRFLGSGVGKSLLTGAAQYASQRLMGTDSDTALDAGIMAGATYGAGMAANKLMQPSQQQIAKTDAIRQGNIAKQQAYMDAIAPENFTKTTKMVVPQTDPNAGNYTRLVDPSQDLTITSVKEQFPTLAEGLRPGMTPAELDAQRGIAQADYDALQAPTDKFNIPGLGEINKSDVYSGIGAGTIGALGAVPEEEEEKRKRKEIEMAKPYSDPVTYPGAGYGSREYGYFGPNYGMYAKEGGHIKRMQEGGDVGEVSEVDEGLSAFSGDLMAFAPAIAGGANYGIGAMPTAMDSSEYNYGVAPNMGGYDYRSFVPADMQGQGITSVGTGMGTGEQITGDPNLVQRGMAEDAATKKRKEAVTAARPKLPVGYIRVTSPVTGETKIKKDPYHANYLYSGGKEGGLVTMQEGGITSLPQTEGQVDGNGDGMSDEVYGDIENQQEVALSKDEFIVPADVVSSLGNGSSDAGADELYRMMERVRMAKSGKKTQPPEIDAEDYLPA